MTQLNPKFRDVLATLGAPEDAVATSTSGEWSAMSLLKAIYAGVQTIGAPDMDIASDSGSVNILLATETLTIAGGTGLATSGAANTITVDIDDAELLAIAGLTSAADRLPYFTGSGTASLATFTAAGRAILDDADATTQLTTLGLSANGKSLVTAADYAAMKALLDLEIGTDVQAYDADLTTWAGLTPSANAQSLVTAADYSAMRTLLGLVIGTNVQAYDADLTTWAGLTPSANAQSLVTAADYSAMRTLLSLVPGTDVQAQDAELAAIAGLTSAADRVPYFTGSGTAALATFTSYGRTLAALADEDALEALLDTLPNLTSIQGRTVTLADAGFDVLIAWDDSASAYKNMALADLTDEGTPATGDYIIIYGAEGDMRKANWSTLPGAGGGISNVSEDTSPSLGGALDGDGFDVIDIGVLTMREQAAAEADVAGLGQWWVQTATPNLPMFTNDAGDDFQLATLAGTETLTNKSIAHTQLTGLGAGVGTFLGTPSYTNLAAALTGSVLKTAGKETIWMPASAMWPRTTNGPSAVNRELTTGGDIQIKGWGFDTTTEEAVQFYIGPPKSWNLGTITFQPVWTNTAGASTETVSWGLSVGAYTDSDALDSTDLGTEVRVSDTWLAQNDIHVSAESGAVTVGNTPIAGDILIGQIARSVANDNLTGDAELLGVYIFFTTSATNDA
jgi:hypothetical protein